MRNSSLRENQSLQLRRSSFGRRPMKLRTIAANGELMISIQTDLARNEPVKATILGVL
jgi:hypothetical protein